MLFGMYVIVWHIFGLLVLLEKKLFGIFSKPGKNL